MNEVAAPFNSEPFSNDMIACFTIEGVVDVYLRKGRGERGCEGMVLWVTEDRC